jgi:hypothetical protein
MIRTKLLTVAFSAVLLAGSANLIDAQAERSSSMSSDAPLVPAAFPNLRSNTSRHSRMWVQSNGHAQQACLNEDSVCPQGNLKCCPGLVCAPVGSYGKMCQKP